MDDRPETAIVPPDDLSPVYYRLYWPRAKSSPCVVTMQWFDEHDYLEDRFISDDTFDSEDEAHAALTAWLDLLHGRVDSGRAES